MDTQAGVILSGVVLSVLHSIFPNHWGPFVLIGQARRWSDLKLAGVTFAANLLHIGLTIIIGLAVAYGGMAIELFPEEQLGRIAGWALLIMGAILVAGRLTGKHFHSHFDPNKYARGADTLLIVALFGMLSLSPCAAIFPIFLLAASGGPGLVAALSILIIAVTAAVITFMVVFMRHKLAAVKLEILEENEGLISGLVLMGLSALAFRHQHDLIDQFVHTVHRVTLAAWDVFQDASLYILFGSIIGGLVYVYIKPERVVKYLGRGQLSGIVTGSLIGAPLPLCSCGVVPTALALRKMGANKSATMSFLMTTPETGVDSIAVTYALLGPIYAVYRPIAAILMGIIAGIFEWWLGDGENGAKELAKTHSCCEHGHAESPAPPAAAASPGFFKNIKTAFAYGLGEFMADISGWLVAGFLIAGVITALIPPDAIEHALGGGLFSMILMWLVATPLYICASATTPLAAALLMKGASPGAALVLLLAGPATNAASLTVLTGELGKRTMAIYVSVIAVTSIVMGLLLNQIFDWLGKTPQSTMTHAHKIFSDEISLAGAVALGALIIFHLIRKGYQSVMKHDHNHAADA